MVGTSKILTVSYGTFSCTLEGFDDSFSTMKAIAEYFRDLAADDRYFGAEPPTPDAEMLARIAEREIARRVEARTDGTGIVLRAGSALTAPAEAEPADEAATAPPQDIQTPAQEPAARAEPAEMAQATPGSETEAPASALLAVSEPEGAALTNGWDDLTEEDLDAAFHSDADDEDGDDDADVEDYSVDFDSAGAPVAEDDDDIFEPQVAAVAAPAVTMPPAAQRPAPRQVMVGPAADDADDQDSAVSSVMAAVSKAAKADAPKSSVAAKPAAPVIQTASPAAIPAHPDADSVAAKLQRIRAVVGRSAPAADTAEDDDANAPGPAASTLATQVQADVEEAEAIEPEAYEAPEAEAEPVRAEAFDAPEKDAPEQEEASSEPEPEPADEPKVEAPQAAAAPIRARVIKMRRADFSKAVTGGLLEATDKADAPAEDAAAPAEAKTAIGLDWGDDDQSDLVANAELDDFSDLADDVGETDLASQFDSDADANLIEDDTADLEDLARLDGVATPEAPSDLSDEDEAELMAELAEVEREMGLRGDTDAEPDVAPQDFDDEPESLEANAPHLAEDTAESEAYETAADDTETTADTDVEAEVEPEIEEQAQIDTDADIDLTVAAEADGEIEAMAEVEATAEPEADAPAAATLRPRRVQMPQGPDEDEDAVSRIMSRTDAQLSEPESNRRREAITQLKAAVAAKEADTSLGKTTEDTGEIESAFRNDLRQVVRPRRPLTAEARTERPRAAPLKLVASQRVDLPKEAADASTGPVTPVRPRRVAQEEAAPVVAAASDAGSFAEFAEEMGASSLSDLLEAAAAYTAFVEGSEDFSRPQLLNKIKESRDDISREEGLRSFGTLLREGRIMKVRNGRFQVSDETRFHPERRAG